MNADTYVTRLADETYRRFAFRAESANEATHWQSAFRQELINMLGLPVIAGRGTPSLNARLISTEDVGDHTRELWELETEPGFSLPFYFLHPKDAEGRLPLVLTPHGHGKLAKKTYVGIWESEADRKQMEEGERDIALQAVREGYRVIAPDMRGFADLRLEADRDKDATCSCRRMQMHALLYGRTLVGERVWDIARLIDWASTRDDIEAGSIVVTGNSGGGTVTLFAAAVDERIRVAVPASYFCTFEGSIGAVPHCECNYVPGIMKYGEMSDVAALIAPRYFMAVNGREDRIFPITETKKSYERLRRAYAVFGIEARCRLSIGDGGHRYYKKDVWPFVRESLAKGL